jgi:NAD(P)-dependent dehydrogenase (short-subunit alcohol dehydrogenase family)
MSSGVLSADQGEPEHRPDRSGGPECLARTIGGMDLENCSVLVAGGASGLGAATAKAMADRGARVVVFDLNEAGAKQVAHDVGGEFCAGDAINPDDVQRAVDVAADSVPLRIAVNCAGIAWAERVLNREGKPHDLPSFERVLDLNVVGTFNVMTRAAAAIARAEPLEEGERGVIVNTASVAAFEGQIGQLAYSASKGAIVAMTLPAARDLSVLGIRVMTVAPGTFETPLLGSVAEGDRKKALEEQVLFPKVLGQPWQFAQLVVDIVSNRYLNGEVIRLDGGIRMQPR